MTVTARAMILHNFLKRFFLHDDNGSDVGDPAEYDLTFGETDADFESGHFLNSLEDLTEDDIELSEHATRASRLSLSEVIRRILFVFFLTMFVISCFLLVQNMVAKYKGKQIYDRLEQQFLASGFDISGLDAIQDSNLTPDSVEDGDVKQLAADSGLTTTPSMTEALRKEEENLGGNVTSVAATDADLAQLDKMKAGLTSLAQINEDIYGWIYVEGTEINYPLVQGTDNDYYLDHAYTGDFYPIGSIFVDFRCHETINRNFNTVLYGHNITSGTMFHDITKFFDDEYFNNTKIYIYTMDGIFIYEPFSIYETRYDYNYFRTEFMKADEFIAFAEEMRDNSAKEKAMTFDGGDRVLTLSTCTNGAFYARYALHAKLVKAIFD